MLTLTLTLSRTRILILALSPTPTQTLTPTRSSPHAAAAAAATAATAAAAAREEWRRRRCRPASAFASMPQRGASGSLVRGRAGALGGADPGYRLDGSSALSPSGDDRRPPRHAHAHAHAHAHPHAHANANANAHANAHAKANANANADTLAPRAARPLSAAAAAAAAAPVGLRVHVHVQSRAAAAGISPSPSPSPRPRPRSRPRPRPRQNPNPSADSNHLPLALALSRTLTRGAVATTGVCDAASQRSEPAQERRRAALRAGRLVDWGVYCQPGDRLARPGHVVCAVGRRGRVAACEATGDASVAVMLWAGGLSKLCRCALSVLLGFAMYTRFLRFTALIKVPIHPKSRSRLSALARV